MIGFFPIPYPDELVYSVCARFADRMRFPTVTGTMEALFGRRHAVAIVDFPHALDDLVGALPGTHPATAESLMDDHTLLPYHGPFLQNATYTAVRQFMKGSADRSVRVRCGLSTSRVRPPTYFRSCPACDTENRTQYGETYWHRLFQVTGVEVCPKHQVFLEASGLRMSPLSSRHQFIAAEASVVATTFKPTDPNMNSHQILLAVARDTDWLLQQRAMNPGLETLHARYVELLRAHGFMTAVGTSVRIADLRREMNTFFTPRLLELLQSPIPDTPTAGWLGRLLHKPDTASAPLRHLLLMQFLGVSAADFFNCEDTGKSNLPAQTAAVGWPCLNPACAKFRKPVIKTYSIEHIRKRKADAALFACPACGYTYARYDWSKPAATPDFVRDYGPQWLDWLKTMWLDTTVSVKYIADLLGVDSKTVKSHALQLKLPFPRKGTRSATTSGIYQRKPLQPRFTRQSQRRAWLDLCAANRGLGLKRLRALAPALYTWLYRHDREWLRANQPRAATQAVPRPRVDWKKRDEELAPQVATMALHLKHGTGRLQQVTVTAIARALGRQSLFEKNLQRLVLTRTVVRDVVESAEDFAIRRIIQSASHLRWQFGYFERWQLVRAAGLRPELERLPRVRASLDYELIRTVTA